MSDSDSEGRWFESSRAYHQKTLDELLQLDFGGYFDEKYRGLKIATVEDILKKFAGQIVKNIDNFERVV